MRTGKAFRHLVVAAVILAPWSSRFPLQAQDVPEMPAFKTTVNVERLGYLRKEERAKLAANGFVISVRPGERGPDEAANVYIKAKNSHFPIFVSSDAVLHTSHLVFDWWLRFLEASSLRQDLINLTDVLLTRSLTDHEDIPAAQAALKDAAMKNALFFNVAKCLLTDSGLEGVPKETRDTIEKELALINAHKGIAPSPLFGCEEDYSQYVPRGHYSRSEEFRKYFKAMIWYGRMGFRLSPVKETGGKIVLDDATGATETLQALLICRGLANTKIKGETARAVWNRIYESTSFFAGRSDDLGAGDYAAVMTKVYGDDPALTDLADDDTLAQFVARARQLPKPRILSTVVTDVSAAQVDWQTQTQAFRFMGQRFTPDADVFQNLVYDAVTGYMANEPAPFTAVDVGGALIRGWPRGLDAMAAFGSETALEILKAEGDTAFKNYDTQFAKMKKRYATADAQQWTQDLYGSRLWALKAIMSAPADNAPPFMKTPAWRKKQLNAALGSWTELKHDTIVYTKQPYAMRQAAMAMAGKASRERHLPAELVRGYVEPVPELYAHLRQAFTKMRENYKTLGFPEDRALVGNLVRLEDLLASLETIAAKELARQALTDEEYSLIESIGYRFRTITRYAHYRDVHESFISKVDNKMALVADVFTQPNEGRVLEEAVGKPAEIFVIAPVNGRDKVCLGVAYATYEFKHPMSDRLTDEKWRELLEQNKQPAQPTWTQDIVVTHRR